MTPTWFPDSEMDRWEKWLITDCSLNTLLLKEL